MIFLPEAVDVETPSQNWRSPKGVTVKIICSVPLMVRIAFWLLAAGFTLGALIGYQAGTPGGGSSTIDSSFGDIRAVSGVLGTERTESQCTYILFS
jgi:hypothetical protein